LIWLYLTNFKEIKLDKKIYTDNVVKIDILNIPTPKPKKIVKKESRKKVKKKKVKRVKKAKKVKKTHISKKKIVKRNIKKRNAVVKEKFIAESEMLYIPNPIIKEKTEVKNSESIDISYPNSKVKKLYGREFHTYTPTQKEFIEKNLDEIHKITQETLWRRGYPGGITSARTGQEGTNIVSFYLYPNGDISNLRLKKKVGYRVLDNNTIETIKSAYKDYPYPKERTKIIFFVEYSIFGY
jgi:TonB family protein